MKLSQSVCEFISQFFFQAFSHVHMTESKLGSPIKL